MAIVGKGFIKFDGKRTTATVYATRKSSVEYAVLGTGLLVLSSCYEWEDVFEVENESELAEVDAMLTQLAGS